MHKITLSADRLWLLRSIKTSKDGEKVETRYYETEVTWNKSPLEATIFQNYESAELHKQMVYYNFKRRAPNGWADGSTEVFDVVSLYTEILHSPNGKHITIKPE